MLLGLRYEISTDCASLQQPLTNFRTWIDFGIEVPTSDVILTQRLQNLHVYTSELESMITTQQFLVMLAESESGDMTFILTGNQDLMREVLKIFVYGVV
jgi:hypothetical protein